MLLGDEDRPLPNMFGTMMKYFSGLRVMSGPMSQSFSQCLPARIYVSSVLRASRVAGALTPRRVSPGGLHAHL